MDAMVLTPENSFAVDDRLPRSYGQSFDMVKRQPTFESWK